MQFILASESARRVDLLRMAGFDFETQKSGFPEVTLETPAETVETNARGKALAVANQHPEHVVLGSDTVVYLPSERKTFGQAKSGEEVRAMLRALRGRTHEVHSGVAIARGEEYSVRRSVTSVRVRDIEDADLDAYAALGEGVGKAGGYAIQGKAAIFVEWIGGDYSGVVGLPLALTVRMLGRFGVVWS